MALLRPLLLDNVPSIQQSAALALGRLANYSDELAEAVVSNEILPQLVYSLSEQNVSGLPAKFKFLEVLQESCGLRPQVGR
jgi:HEAT repeat protein